MPQKIQLIFGTDKARLINNARAMSMPTWKDTATRPHTPPIMIVTTNNRWRSVGVSRTRSAPSRLRTVVDFVSACSDPFSPRELTRGFQYMGRLLLLAFALTVRLGAPSKKQ